LRRGYLTGAQLEGHWAPLGEILRDAGAIDDSQLRRSLESTPRGDELQGRSLRESGVASAAAIEAALRRQAEMRLERLAAMASAEEIRRAYHRLARLVHPDARPDAALAARRELERRFAQLSDAYRALSTAAT